jgi:hypothetical protein
VIDGVILLILSLMWLTQPTHLRQKDIPALLAIVLCIKAVYFIDREQSMNFKTEADLMQLKEWVSDSRLLVSFLPCVFMFMLENKINRHHNFGQLHALMSHGLTAIVFAYNWVLVFHNPK